MQVAKWTLMDARQLERRTKKGGRGRNNRPKRGTEGRHEGKFESMKATCSPAEWTAPLPPDCEACQVDGRELEKEEEEEEAAAAVKKEIETKKPGMRTRGEKS